MRALACRILIALRLIPRPAFTACRVADHPDPATMASDRIYIVGGRGYNKWAYFRCPADRDEIIQLALMRERRPRWTVAVDWLGRPTISPSVRQIDGTRAHFWIRRGAVEWCVDSGRGAHRP